jgi:hypothetical protein
MWPKRADEVLNGGSLYWVFKGLVLCRQRILRLDEVDRGDGIVAAASCWTRRWCASPPPRAPVPGLALPAAGGRAARPEDGPRGRTDALPPAMQSALAEIGVL